MKIEIFGKSTAVVISSLMIFSGSALAMKSPNQELTNAEALGEVELLMAQNNREKKKIDFDAVSNLAVEATTLIGDVQAKLQGVSQSELPGKNALSNVLVKLESTIGNVALLADNQALTEGKGISVANTIANLSTTVGDVAAKVATTAKSEEGKAVANTAVQAATEVGNIALEIKSEAQVGGK